MAMYSTVREAANSYKKLPEIGKGYITGIMLGMLLERESAQENKPERSNTGQKGA